VPGRLGGGNTPQTMSRQHNAEFIAGIGTTAVVLLGLNRVAASTAPMLRFVLAVAVAAGVVALVRNASNSETG
jgi:hypothetical protein